jgi:hypothetical protein
MILNFPAVKSSSFQQFCVNILLAVVLVSLLSDGIYAQTKFSREQFSQINVKARAAYFESEILRAANAEGVDPNILWTICYNETRFRPYLTSPKNARGLMQFIPATAARFSLKNPYEPVPAIRAAARYVRVLSNLFSGRIDSILAAYNSGEGTVSAYLSGRTFRMERKIINPGRIKTIGGVPPYTETIQYVGRGLKIYRWLILRTVFPASSVRANFPTVISQAVARVGVFDRELGNVPDFNNLAILPQLQNNQVAEMKTEITPNNPQDEKQTPNPNNSNLAEVYYDSRSGSRYLLKNGKREKLDDAGVVVINETTRPETTNKARSTFFAAPLNN